MKVTGGSTWQVVNGHTSTDFCVITSVKSKREDFGKVLPSTYYKMSKLNITRFCVKKEMTEMMSNCLVFNNHSLGFNWWVMSNRSGTGWVRLTPLWWRRGWFSSTFGLKSNKRGGLKSPCWCTENVSFATHGKPCSSQPWQAEAPTLGAIFFQSWPKWKHLVLIRDSGCDSCSGSCEDLALGLRRGAVALVQNTQIFPR